MTNEIITKLVVDLSKPEGHPERVQSIPLTEQELEQRELDRIAAEEAEAARLQEQADLAALKQSAQDKLKALGLSDLEVAALTGA
jgi:hypothetical protein